MKRLISVLVAVLVLPVLSAGSPVRAAGKKIVHSVVGTGLVDLNNSIPVDIAFRTTISAHEDSDGNVWGRIVSDTDFGPGTCFVGCSRIFVVADVDCLEVDGPNAWVGGTIRVQGGDFPISLVGFEVVAMVFDLGGAGQDIMHTEIFDPGFSCTERPGLYESQVESGDFQVE